MKQPTVVLVDRREITHTRFTPALERAGYRVCNERCPDRALRRLGTQDVSVLVSELRVRCRAGHCLARTVKDNPETSSIPVVCLSEAPRLRDMRYALRAGVDSLLLRSAEPRVLLDLLAQLRPERPSEEARRRAPVAARGRIGARPVQRRGTARSVTRA